MKLLSAAVLLQTVAILFLAVEIIDMNRTLSDSAAVEVEPAAVENRWDAAAPNSLPLDESRLVAIIREEIGAALASSQPSATVAVAEESFQPTPEQVREVEMKLDRFVNTGQMSQMDLEVLQTEIVQLGKGYREEMLGYLAKAVNSGSVRITLN